MNFVSIRSFYLENATPDSCNYCAFTRKMKRLLNDMGANSGMTRVNPTLIVLDVKKTHLYLLLLQKRTRQIKDAIAK